MAGDGDIDTESAGQRWGDPAPLPPVTPGQRVILAIWLLASLFLNANAVLGWGLLGSYDEVAAALALIIGLALLYPFMRALRRAD